MIRRILWFIPIVLMAGYAFWGLEWTDYQKGYNQALRDLETARDDARLASELGDRLFQAAERWGIDPVAVDPDRPGDWQAGYRQALRDYARQDGR